MRRLPLLVLVLVLVVASCGDDDSAGSTTTSASGSTSTTPATSSSGAATTSEASTTTRATTTTTAAGNAALEAAVALQGTYEGQWDNTTFGSSGPISLTIDVDEAAQFATITLDLGGNVFGMTDPDPIVCEADLVGDPETLEQTDSLFGESTASFGPSGEFMLVAPMLPQLQLAFTVDGQLTPAGATGTYTITDLAEGTFEVAPVG